MDSKTKICWKKLDFKLEWHVKTFQLIERGFLFIYKPHKNEGRWIKREKVDLRN